MKWIYAVGQKSKAALILSLVFVFIIAKNWLDKKNVLELGSSFSSVYEDRLLAESYIYKISDHLYQKKIMLDNCTFPENNRQLQTRLHQYNASINQLILNYENTHLTPTELTFFKKLKHTIFKIRTLEANYFQAKKQGLQTDNIHLHMDQEYTRAAGNLHQLSGIQVAEGKLLNDKSKRIIAGSNLLTQFELALLIGIGIVIQVLIFATKSVLPRFPQNPGLN